VPVSLTPTQRGIVVGVAAAALLAGAFALGAGQGGTPAAAALPAGAAVSRITVTGTGAVSGTPDQLILSMGVQTSGSSVSSALQRANQAVRAVTRALTRTGVRSSDIQTSGLSIQPAGTAGTQISDAARAGGNATVVDGVSLNLNDSGSLLAAARTRAVADARAKAAQYAKALGRSLGPVVNMSEQSPVQSFPMDAAGAAPSAATPSPVPVHPGSQQVSVTVTVVFALA
jgi:uncharacterized protein